MCEAVARALDAEVAGAAADPARIRLVVLRVEWRGRHALLVLDPDVFPRRPEPLEAPAGALDQLVPAQLAEQLLQIGQGNLLPLADRRQGDGPAARAQAEIDHRGDGKTAFGGQTHGVCSLGARRRLAGWGARHRIPRQGDERLPNPTD